MTVFDPSIEDSEEYKKVHQEYKATVSIYKNCETCINKSVFFFLELNLKLLS